MTYSISKGFTGLVLHPLEYNNKSDQQYISTRWMKLLFILIWWVN